MASPTITALPSTTATATATASPTATETPLPTMPAAATVEHTLTAAPAGMSDAVLTATADVSGAVVLAAAGYTLTVEGLSAGDSVTLTPGAALSATQLPTGTQFVLSLASVGEVSSTQPVTMTVRATLTGTADLAVWTTTAEGIWAPAKAAADVDVGSVRYVLDATQRQVLVRGAGGD